MEMTRYIPQERPDYLAYQVAGPLLVFNPEGTFPFGLNIDKARLALKHIEEIRAFVASEGRTCLIEPKMRPTY
jgi:hypothetical protein